MFGFRTGVRPLGDTRGAPRQTISERAAIFLGPCRNLIVNLIVGTTIVSTMVACGENSGFVDKAILNDGLQDGSDLLPEVGSEADASVFLPDETGDGDLPGAGGEFQSQPNPATIPPAIVPPSPVVPASPVVPVLVVDPASVVLTDRETKSVPVAVHSRNEAGEILDQLPVDADLVEVSVSDSSVASVWFDPGTNAVQIDALAPGNATVTVTYGDSQQTIPETIPVQVVPGVPVIRLGVNFEDIPSGGDLDYNDAVFCFSGRFAHDNRSVVSLAEQVVRINVTNRSGCDHDILIGVIDQDGTRREIPMFRSRSQPTLDMVFHPGSRLDVRMLVADSCRKDDSFWVTLGTTVPVAGPNYGKPLVEVLNDVCRTTGS